MHRKFDVRRFLTAFFVGIFAVVGSIVAIDAPANAVAGDASTVDYALSFNGTTDYLEATEGTQYASRAVYTVEAWAKPSSVTCATGSLCTIASHDGDWWIGIKDSKFQYLVYQAGQNSNTGYVDSGVTAAANAWAHVALVRNDTALSFYVNGSLAKTSTLTSGRSTYSGYPIKVGAHYGNFFSGQIDELKLWSSVRDVTAIASDMHTYQSNASSTSGLLAYFDFNEGGTNSTINNRVGVGANLVFVNASPVISYIDVKTTTIRNGKTVVTFPRSYLTPSGGWTVPMGITRLNVLIVAGGGAGGSGGDSTGAGGGGAGGLIETTQDLSSASVAKITVGQGGIGDRSSYWLDGFSGQNSKFGDALTAIGGGGGGGRQSASGKAGGSGGGVSGRVNAATAGGAGTTGQGYKGGDGRTAAVGVASGSGGGGAASAGSSTAAGGAGGNAVTSAITNSSYSAGGAGGVWNSNAVAADGSPNTGNGGGGSGGSYVQANGFWGSGGSGGSGIVVIAYAPVDDKALTTGASNYASATGQVFPASADYSMEVWVKPDAIPANHKPIIATPNDLTFGTRFYLGTYNLTGTTTKSKLHIAIGNSFTETKGMVQSGIWSHVAVAISGTTASIYLDGKLDTTLTVTQVAHPAGVTVGYSQNTGAYSGQLDQFKVWSSALSESQIQRSMNTHTDTDATGQIALTLIHAFDFNLDNSGVYQDLKGTSDLSKNGSPTLTNLVTSSSSSIRTVYTFTRSVLTAWGGWFSPYPSSTTEALIVGGGGGGGKSGNPSSLSAGSGAGGAVYPISSLTLPTTAVPVIVGQAGAGSTSDTGTGNAGGFSAIGSLKVAGGAGGNSYLYTGTTQAGPGGSDFVAGGNGGGGRQEVGASSASYALGGLAGSSASQTFNGTTFSSLAGVAGTGDYASDSGSGGLGGQSIVRTSSVTGTSVEYGKQGLFAPWNLSLKTYGSGGSTNYGYGSGSNTDPGEAGANGVVIVAVKTANTITFDANGGTSTLAVQNISIGGSANLSSASGTVLRTGYTFTGWNTQANNYGTAYSGGQSVSPTNDMTLYAQWIPNSPVLYYNFSDRDSTYDGTTTVTNLGSNSTYTGTKMNTPTHDYSNGTLNFTGSSYANGQYVDVADMTTNQFSGGITVDFEADFGSTAENWERILDFGVSGQTSSNILVSRENTSSNIVLEIYNGSTSQGTCKVAGGIPATAQMIRWTFTLDGTNCRVWKDGVAQTVSTALYPGYTVNVSPTFAPLPAANATWTTNYIAKSNWSADGAAILAVRSLRLYAGVMTSAQVGAITYRTVSFDANYTGSSSLTSRYTSGKTALQTAPNRAGYTFSGWYDNITSASGTLIGGSGAVYSPLSSPLALYGAWAANVGNPTISSQPASVTKSAGQTATFSVTAASPDSGTLSYQWEVSANNGTNWLSVSGGTGATTSSYTTPTLVSADLGKQYRVVVTNTLNGATATTTSNAATLTIGLDKINVAFDELNYDFSNILHLVGTNGKLVNNKVLFLNVTTKDGIQVDSVVTTEVLSSATIANYESGTGAGGANSYFQADVDFTAANGYAQFKFDFYKHGVAGAAGNPCTVANPTCTGATKVTLQNVNVSAIDIDYNQWNEFTAAESYTLAGNTKLKECPIPNTGTCTARTAPSSYPADIRFQGSADTARTNDPIDMAIVTYADIETFRIKFGRSASGSPNYFGVAFKALDWGTTTPQTTGGTANYTISYDVNGATTGSQTGTHVGPAGSQYTVLTAGTAVKTGYTFAGWATTSTATTATYTSSSKVTMPGSNLTLYAVWTPIKYTLTYNANGGTGAPALGSYDAGASVSLSSTVPIRAGYVFGGWDTVVNSGNGNSNYASGASYTMPAANTTLYAKWTVANGTLAYNGNNGTTTEASVTAAGGTTTTVATGGNTSRTGYDFVGWNSKADGTGTSYAVGATFTLVASVTTTVYAQWTLSKYNLIFNVNGGVGTPQSQSYVQGATTTMPVTNPTRAGYTFGGWNTAANGTGTNYNGSFLMPGNNLTLYAKWTPITYSVLYNNNASTLNGATGTVTDSTAYTAAQVATVASGSPLSNVTGGVTYRFIGWNTNSAGTGTDYMPGDSLTMPASNVTLYAMWLDASIEIAYNANGGTGAPGNANATLGQVFTISATQPTRSGYTFGGWSLQDNSPAGGPFSASGTFTPNSNEILVAQWTPVNYTITYNSDGGSTAPTDPGNKHIDDTITVNSNEPTKTGYTFLGWKDADGNIYPAGGTFKMPPNNVVLTAQWQGNAYTLNYDANGGSAAPAAETRNYNAQANLSGTAPTRTGYTFQGWNTLVGGGGTAYNASASFTMPNSNTTLFAQWTANTYVLTYNTQGGSTAPSSSNKSYGASVTVSGSTPTRSGYSFAGWNTAANGTGTTYLQSAGFNMPDADVTLYAQWTKTAFTLYYNTNGGQGVYSSQPIKYTESVTVDSTIPTKAGFTFSGWNTAADGSGFDYTPMGVFTLNVAANVTLYAKWTAVSYTVTYNANTGSGAPAGGSHVFGATVTTASGNSPLALTGFRFIGWNDRADGSGTTYTAGGTFSMPASNVILYAQWIDSTYQIAYNANGGSGGPDGAVAPDNSSYTISSVEPVRPGYTFGGWKLADGTPTAATLVGKPLADAFIVLGNELLVAQWTINTIHVNYDLNGGGGTTPNQQSGNYNTNVTLASSSGVSRANFQFVGWSTTPDGSGTTYADGSSFKLPTDDVVLYAKWAPIYFIIEYNPAGGTGEPADQFATPTSTVALASQEPTKDGYVFDKWTEVVQGTDFTPGGSLTMPSSNVMLVANYTVRAAGVPGSGNGSNTGIDPNGKPIIAKPKLVTLSVYFKGDSPVLTDRTKVALKKLAALAKSYGRANNITIYGRVKETNDKSYDLRLSKARAANVSAFLKKYGVTGVFQVYAKGISPENTFRSRRVDMKLWWAK